MTAADLRRVTRAETVRRLRALPPDEPSFCDCFRCPLAVLFDLTRPLVSDFPEGSWQRQFMAWADERLWETVTPRQCLEALGEKP